MSCRLRTIYVTCSTIQIVFGGSRLYLSFIFPLHLSPLSAILPSGEKASGGTKCLLPTEPSRAAEARPKRWRLGPRAAPPLLLLQSAEGTKTIKRNTAAPLSSCFDRWMAGSSCRRQRLTSFGRGQQRALSFSPLAARQSAISGGGRAPPLLLLRLADGTRGARRCACRVRGGPLRRSVTIAFRGGAER